MTSTAAALGGSWPGDKAVPEFEVSAAGNA